MANNAPDSVADNPLLSTSYLPYKALPFDKVKVAHLEPALLQGLDERDKEWRAIRNNREAPTFANTIEAIEFCGASLSRTISVFSAFSGANKSKELIALQQKMQPIFSERGARMMNDKRMFARVKAVYESRHSLALDTEQRTLLEKVYWSFASSGFDLPPAKQKRMKEIGTRLGELSLLFNTNVTEAEKEWVKVIDKIVPPEGADPSVEIVPPELEGLPPRVLRQLQAEAKNRNLPEGSYAISLSPPPLEILSHCKNRSTREEVFKAMNAVAGPGPYDNSANVLEIVKLRHEMAQLMGAKTYAEMVLKSRMARKPETVHEFLNKNLAMYQKAAGVDREKIEAAATADGITDYQLWDSAYYAREVQERELNLKVEELRPYFSVDNVLKGVFDHTSKLFNVNFVATKDKYPVYNQDMKVFEVYDNKNGDLLGIFYTDYYARPGAKSSGAWMSSFRTTGLDREGRMNVPHVINVCNYPKPANDTPTLLSLRDVTTLFHEFGHALHSLLSKGKYRSMTGTAVARDFVELPSQLQENWVLEPEVLQSFAVHYKTGEKISEELIEKIKGLENFGRAGQGLRQTWLAMIDMAWNDMTDPASVTSVQEVEDKVNKLTGVFNKHASPGCMSTRFGHIFSGGYAAGYYGYKWAEVLDADIFETKFKGRLYDRENADALRAKIYQPGGSRPPADLFREYMGRDPNPEALYRREGLLTEATATADTPAKAKKRPPAP